MTLKLLTKINKFLYSRLNLYHISVNSKTCRHTAVHPTKVGKVSQKQVQITALHEPIYKLVDVTELARVAMADHHAVNLTLIYRANYVTLAMQGHYDSSKRDVGICYPTNTQRLLVFVGWVAVIWH
mgnify:CR=1 FL=1